jgi:transposase
VKKITTLGVDLAKNVFQLHGVDFAGKAILRREVRRVQLMKTMAQLEPCLIGIEACGGAQIYLATHTIQEAAAYGINVATQIAGVPPR